MGFKEAVRTCLREKYFTFQGRASRSEFWYYYLFVILVVIAIMLLMMLLVSFNPAAIGAGRNIELSTLQYIMLAAAGILVIYLYIPLITAQVRRFHDRNLSGWWLLAAIAAGFIPIVGFAASIAALVITILKGTDGDNKFGQDPLKVQNSADVFA